MSDADDPLRAPFPAELRPLADHVRPAFVPQLGDDDPEGPVSKLGGRPWLPADTAWPTCPHCEKPLHLFLQLDLADLPEGSPRHGRGLVQLLYCTSSEPLCEVDCEAYLPFADSALARLVDPTKPGSTPPVDITESPFPGRAIVGWQETWDLPNVEELGELGVDVDDLDEGVEGALDESQRPLPGDKLGGWPHWIQGIEYPSCSECGETMELLFQIDSEDSLPYMFGDTGCAHLTQCPAHPGVLAFAWACC